MVKPCKHSVTKAHGSKQKSNIYIYLLMKDDRALEIRQIDNQKHFLAVVARLLIDLFNLAKRELVQPLDGLCARGKMQWRCVVYAASG